MTNDVDMVQSSPEFLPDQNNSISLAEQGCQGGQNAPHILDTLYFCEPKEEPVGSCCGVPLTESVLGTTCQRCGRITDDLVLDRQQRATYQNKAVVDDCIGFFVNPLMPRSTMSITIARSCAHNEFQAIRRLHHQYIPRDERMVDQVMAVLRRHCAEFSECILHDTAILFRDLQMASRDHHDCVRGDQRRAALMAAAMLTTCHQHRRWVTHHEIATRFNTTVDQLTRAQSRMHHIASGRQVNIEPRIVTVSDFVSRYTRMLNIPDEAARRCEQAAEIVRQQRLCSNNMPINVTGGLLLLLTDADEQAVSELCAISRGTLRKTARTLCAVLRDCDIPDTVRQHIADYPADPPQEQAPRPKRRRLRTTAGLPSLVSGAAPHDPPGVAPPWGAFCPP